MTARALTYAVLGYALVALLVVVALVVSGCARPAPASPATSSRHDIEADLHCYTVVTAFGGGVVCMAKAQLCALLQEGTVKQASDPNSGVVDASACRASHVTVDAR